MYSVKEIYWLAGLLDGEGCFSWHKFYTQGKYTYYNAKIQLAMTDLDVVERAAKMIGATVHKVKLSKLGRKQMYRFECQGRRAIGWMQTVYPVMGLRRQAKIRELVVLYKNLNKVRC